MTDSATTVAPRPRFGWIDEFLWRFFGSVAWNAASVGLSRILNVLSLLVAVRLLGPARYAELGLIQNTVAMLGVFAGMGLGVTATHRVSQTRRTAPEQAGREIAQLQGIALTGGILAAAFTVLLGPTIAGRVLSSETLGPLLQLAAPLLLGNVFLGVQQGIFVGLERLRAAAMAQTAGGATQLALMSLGAAWDGVRGCLGAQVLAVLLQVVLGQFLLRSVARESSIAVGLPKWTWSYPGFSQFGLPAALSSLLVIPVEWLISVILVNRPHGYLEMGLYSASWQWVSPLLLAPAIVAQTILPIFGERHAAGDRRAPLKILAAAAALNAAVILPLSAAGLLLAPVLLGISGPEYAAALPTLQLLILGACLHALEVPLGSFLMGQGWIWPALFSNLAWAVCLLIGAVLFISGGASGVAAARLVSYACHGVLMLALVWKLQRNLVRSGTEN